MSDLLSNIWYFAGLASDFAKPSRVVIAGEPILIGFDNGTPFGLRDICPHRAAPLSAGRMVEGQVECPYHGWRFGTDGVCRLIPSLTAGQVLDPTRIKVRRYPTATTGDLVWVWLGEGEPTYDPPTYPLTDRKPLVDDGLTLNCHVDHAVVGLMDPAHGPYVHAQWWWRSEHSMHDKAKAFEPREMGFAMAPHSPSSNSFAYKALGGKPVSEIAFRLPGIRTEHIRTGKRQVLSFTAVTPEDASKTRIRQLFFTDHPVGYLLKPFVAMGARKFLRQDARMVDLQQEGLRFSPRLMLIEDADVQAKWYHQLKKEWTSSRSGGRDFLNPVKPRTLRWRS